MTASTRGRRAGGADTRARILQAAREAFAERGIDGASVREVAARAGVDAALVHHYFGTKQRLFVAASQFPVDVAAVVPQLLAGGEAGAGARFVRFLVALWDRPDILPLVLGIVRSASSDEQAAGMTRRLLTEGPLLALARAADPIDAAARASLAGSQLAGLVMARYIVRVEPLATMTPDELADFVGPVIERYLFGESHAAGGPAPAAASIDGRLAPCRRPVTP